MPGPLEAEEALALRRIDAAEMFRGAGGNNWAGWLGSGGFAVLLFRFKVDDGGCEL